MNTQIVKQYTLKDLEKFLNDYKNVRFEDLNGKAFINWNNHHKDIKTHFKDCIKRFNAEIIPDGFYYFCFSTATRNNKQSDKYLVSKGKPPAETPQQITPQFLNNSGQSKNDLISVSAALDYISQIAELKNKVFTLETENKLLKDENAVLNAELESAENDENLSEKEPAGVMEYIKETAPQLIMLADRYFEQQDKKIELERMRLNTGQSAAATPNKKRVIKKLETGSEEHLNFIRMLAANDKDEQLNIELDKLEQANPEKYAQICTELNIDTNEQE